MIEILKKSSFFIIILLIIVLFFIFTNEEDTAIQHSDLHEVPPTDGESAQQGDNVSQSDTVIVDVKGAVGKPGVYEVQVDSRVHDVILLAGDFLENADQTQVNLAQKVQDEMIINVPKIGEASETTENNSSSNGNEKIRINDATQEELETLPGIGPSKAEAIIQHREENGLFKSGEDLLQVSGIGEKTLENLLEHIQVP